MQKKLLRTSVLTLGLLASGLTSMMNSAKANCECVCLKGDNLEFRLTTVSKNEDECKVTCSIWAEGGQFKSTCKAKDGV